MRKNHNIIMDLFHYTFIPLPSYRRLGKNVFHCFSLINFLEENFANLYRLVFAFPKQRNITQQHYVKLLRPTARLFLKN